MLRMDMKYLIGLLFLFLSAPALAEEVSPEIFSQVEKIAQLYGDGYAFLEKQTVQVKDVIEPQNGYCVTLVSFYMSGFSGGNNSSQFIAFLKCRGKTGNYDTGSEFVKSIIGIHPFYHHRNKYDLASAKYNGRVISIDSPIGQISFTNQHSIWWSQNEQIDI